MRVITHPGTPLRDRAAAVLVCSGPTVRLTVIAGQDLFDGIHDRLKILEAPGGSFVLVAGAVSRLTIMTGGAGRDLMPIGYCGPHVLVAPLMIVAGAGGTGVDEDGARFSHCHAAFRDSGGRLVGGHLLLGDTIAGDGGITLDLVPLLNARFVRRIDPETRFTVFHPETA